MVESFVFIMCIITIIIWMGFIINIDLTDEQDDHRTVIIERIVGDSVKV